MIDIDGYLKALLGKSSPGDSLHYLVVHATDRDGEPRTNICAIVPDQTVDAGCYVAYAVTAKICEAVESGLTIMFAGLAMEVHMAPREAAGAKEVCAKRRLHEHAQAIEATVMYAAARDGRRWVGEHFLTGPDAGRVDGPTILTGPMGQLDAGLHKELIRSAVGIYP